MGDEVVAPWTRTVYRRRIVSTTFPGTALTEAPAMIRVLVADDEPALRGALSELLAQEEHVELVGMAADADEAIAMAERDRPDVALVDVKMPAGGGPRAAREIGRLSPTTRVIALSAFEDRPTVLEMLRAGAVGYLVKGTAAEEIVGSIKRVAGGGTSLSAEVIGGIVHELSSQLRREEIEIEQREAKRDEIRRFVRGEGLSMAFQPIVDLEAGGPSVSRPSRGSARSRSEPPMSGSPRPYGSSSAPTSSWPRSARRSSPSRCCRTARTCR